MTREREREREKTVRYHEEQREVCRKTREKGRETQ